MFLYRYPKLIKVLLVLDFKILDNLQEYFEKSPMANLNGYHGAEFWNRSNTTNPFCIQIENNQYFQLMYTNSNQF